MQSSLQSQIQWKTLIFDRPRRNLLPKAPISATSLESPLQLERRKVSGIVDTNSAVLLPLVVRRSGRCSRYVWNGYESRLWLVPYDNEDFSDRFDLSEQLHGLLSISIRELRKLLVPQHVQGNYLRYLKWKLLHRVFSSALQVLATQAMFRAIGFGPFRSLPSAAALNWVLKDGLGRFSRCLYTASIGSAFDTNLKRVRFSTSILFSLSIGVELLTPAFPHYFLLLATIANIAKSISRAAYSATSSAIYQSFAIGENLGEVSAKAQIQTVCFDNLGLMLAALLNILCKNSQRLLVGLPLVIYPIFAAVDLFAIYQGLKHVHLHTLTKERLAIIIDEWVKSGIIPSPADVSCKEDIFFGCKGNKSWPIRIGCIGEEEAVPKHLVLTIQSLTSEDLYFICQESSRHSLIQKPQPGILLCLLEKAGTADIIMGMFQACLIREALLSRAKGGCKEAVADANGLSLSEWFEVLEDSKGKARRRASFLVEEIERTGWSVKKILLSSKEMIRCSWVDE